MSDVVGRGVIEVELNDSGVDAGVAKIERRVENLGKSVAAAGQTASAGIKNIGEGGEQAAAKVDRVTANIERSIQRQVASFQAGEKGSAAFWESLAKQRGANLDALKPAIANLEKYQAEAKAAAEATQRFADSSKFLSDLKQRSESIGKTAADLAEMRAAQLGVADAAAPLIAKLRAAEQPLKSMGVSAAQTAAAMRQVPAQFTDIVTALQGGQRPLTVLLQQGGQLKDMFGGIGPAARALGGYILGLVNPYTLAAVAVGGLAIAYHQGAKEAEIFNRTLILTGQTAKITAGQLAQIAQSVSKAGGTQGNAAAALNEIASTGKVATSNLEQFTRVAVQMERLVGKSFAETAKEFAELAKSPVDASLKLNEQYRYLNDATFKRIKALQDQGRAEEAAEAAQKAYADSFDDRAKKLQANLGAIEKSWKFVTDVAKGAWDAMLGIGREQTLDDRIAKLKELQSRTANPGNALSVAGQLYSRDTTAQKVGELTAQKLGELESTAAGAVSVQIEQDKVKWRAEGNKYLTREMQLKQAIQQIEEQGKAANIDRAEIDKRIALERQKFSDIYSDSIDSQIEKVKRRSQIDDELSKRSLDQLAAKNKLGFLTEKQYIEEVTKLEIADFERKKKELEKELTLTAKKQNSLKDQANLQGQIKLLGEQEATRKQKLSNDLAAQEEANIKRLTEFEAEELRKRGQLADAFIADYNAKYREQLRIASLEAEKGDARRLQALQRIFQSGLSDAQFSEVKSKYDALFADLQAQLDHVNQAAEANGGIFAKLDAAGASEEIRAKAIPALRELGDELNRIAKESGSDSLKKQATDVSRTLEKEAKKIEPIWKDAIKSIDETFQQSFESMLEKGTSLWESFATGLKNIFKKTVADAIYQSFARPIVMNVVASVGGGLGLTGLANAANLAGGSGGMGIFGTALQGYGMYNNAGGILNTVGGWLGLGGAAAAGMGVAGATGLTAAAGAGSLLGAGAAGAGTMGAVGATGLSLGGATAGGGLAAMGGGTGLLAAEGAGAALGAGAAGAAGSAGIMGGIGSALAAIPVWGWMALAAAAIIGGQDDGPEENTYLNFGGSKAGSGNIGWGTKTDTAFGPYGVVEDFWAGDALVGPFRKNLDAYLSSIALTDKVLAANLTADEIAQVTDRIATRETSVWAGPEHTDPASVGSYDKAFRAHLRDVVEAVDENLLKFIDTFEGTSQALADEMVSVLSVRKNIDDLANVFGETVTIDSIAALRGEGEVLSQTVARLVTTFQLTDAIAVSLGKDVESAFGAIGLASDTARERLVKFAGGLDNLKAGAIFFAENFLTEAERLAPTIKQVTEQMSALGYAGIDTKEEFAQLVKGLDLSTEAGAQLYAKLIGLAPAFAQVAEYQARAAEEAKKTAEQAIANAKRQAEEEAAARKKALEDARDRDFARVDTAFNVLTRAIDAEKSRLQTIFDQESKAIEQRAQAAREAAEAQLQASNTALSTLQGIYGALTSALTSAQEMTRAEAQRVLNDALARSNAGESLANIPGLEKAVQAIGKQDERAYATFAEFKRDRQIATNTIEALKGNAGAQVSVAQMTVDAIKGSIDAINVTSEKELAELTARHDEDINRLDTIITNAQAQIDALHGIDNSVRSVEDAIKNLNGAIAVAKQNPIISGTDAIKKAFNDYLYRAPETAGLAYWQDRIASGTSISDVVSEIANSNEAKVQRLYQSILGRVGEAEGVNYWRNELEDGKSYDTVRQAFLSSIEYLKRVRGFAIGTNYVPDDMYARIHQGERIIPAADNAALIAALRNPSRASEETAAEIRALRAENREMKQSLEDCLYAIAKYTQASAETIEKFDIVGMPAVRS